ncbi:MAG: tyrosine-type recombinase/integrase [Lachnospiraceae bacterium]
MSESLFRSGLAEQMESFLAYKEAAGYQRSSFTKRLSQLDQFCVERDITEVRFTEEDAAAWAEKRPCEADATHYGRVNFAKNFLIFLGRKGFDVYVPRDVKAIPTDFKPHIYTDDEIERYFHAVDTYAPDKGNKKNLIQLPVLFRLLYCCGTRINETLGIRKKDVDLDHGIIALHETKNDCARYIVLSDELNDLMAQYADKTFYSLEDTGYIFTTATGKRLSGKTVYELHRKFLDKAGIPYIGDGNGPRIHDWRHTFAVRSFKQMVDSGVDLYVALPVLSTYLGHKTIYATEKYLRLTVSIYPYIEKKWAANINDIFGKAAAYEEN